MGPTILLDKSAFEGLAKDEIRFLVKHYFLVVPPILLREILGDLAKRERENDVEGKWLRALARKILGCDSAIQVDWTRLCRKDLLGGPVEMNRYPHVEGGVPVTAPDGTKGLFFDEPPVMRRVRRWQESEFTDGERDVAKAWREGTRSIDLERIQRDLRALNSSWQAVRSVEEAASVVDQLLTREDPVLKQQLVNVAITMIGLPEMDRNAVFDRWLKRGMPALPAFAPYAAYCVRVQLLFYACLSARLLGTRATNLVDMEYFFYSPFAMIMASNDELHPKLASAVLAADQTFVLGTELKKDLHDLASEWESLDSQQQRQRCRDLGCYPPQVRPSLTRFLWDRYMRPWTPGSGNNAIDMSPEEEKALLDRFLPIIEATKRAIGESGP